jgi:hypothetical protein
LWGRLVGDRSRRHEIEAFNAATVIPDSVRSRRHVEWVPGRHINQPQKTFVGQSKRLRRFHQKSPLSRNPCINEKRQTPLAYKGSLEIGAVVSNDLLRLACAARVNPNKMRTNSTHENNVKQVVTIISGSDMGIQMGMFSGRSCTQTVRQAAVENNLDTSTMRPLKGFVVEGLRK